MVEYESVLEFLEAQRRGRPQTYEEIHRRVNKSPIACQRELRRLVLLGDVRIIVIRFNNRECPFYTVRRDMRIEVVKGPTRY